MTRDPFAGELPGDGDARESYSPAERSFDPALVKEFVTAFMELNSGKWEIDLSIVDAPFERLLATPLDAMEPNVFLDSLLTELGQQRPATPLEPSYMIVDAVVNTLSKNGYNTLYLDISPLPHLNVLCDHAHGTAEKKLALHISGGSVDTLATFAKYCVIDSSIGALTVATNAQDCEVRLLSDAFKVGDRAQRCVFHVPSVQSLPAISPLEMPEQCTWYVASGWTDNHLLLYRGATAFFTNGNRVLVPDGAGAWKEVTP